MKDHGKGGDRTDGRDITKTGLTGLQGKDSRLQNKNGHQKDPELGTLSCLLVTIVLGNFVQC